MPSFDIQSTSLNQYNRKRISQTKIVNKPVKIVFHDVADGKTLKFWDMYYRYYFSDGNEPDKNIAKASAPPSPVSVSQFLTNITPSINPNILSMLPSSISSVLGGTPTTSMGANTNGAKSTTDGIISNTLNSHLFGYNLDSVQNIRNLIRSVDIFQVHGGKFNKVTLVNPRIATFSQDALDYSVGDKTMALTFVLDYEYAYYTIQNGKLGDDNNGANSSLDPFSHSEVLELPALSFNATLMDFIGSNNPLLQSSNPLIQGIGSKVQSAIGNATGSILSNNIVRPLSASVLGSMVSLPSITALPLAGVIPQVQSFASTAVSDASGYIDTIRSIL